MYGGSAMLHHHINQFLDYCRLADFSIRSIQALTARLNEFRNFLKTQRIRSIKRVRYRHLIDFAADFNAPSIHVTKSRVWALRQFYHFLTLHRIVPENIATGLPYPKIEKTVPQFLTKEEYTLLIRHFTDRTSSPFGMRNLIIIMLLGTLGLRTSTLTALNIEDIDLTCGLLWIKEKGRRHRSMVMPHCLCKIIRNYLHPQRSKKKDRCSYPNAKNASPRAHCRISSEQRPINSVSIKSCTPGCSAIPLQLILTRLPASRLLSTCSATAAGLTP